VARLVGRVLIAIAAVACLGALVTVFVVTRTQQPAAFAGGLAATLACAALLAIAAPMAWRGNVRHAVTLALGALAFGVTLFAWLSNMGLHMLLLGVYGIVVLVAGIVVGMRVAGVFAAMCLLALAAMYAAEQRGWLSGVERAAIVPAGARLVTHVLLVGTSLLFAWMLARIVQASLAESRRQEARFRALLGIATDWYWEQDAQLRFTHISQAVGEKTGISPSAHLGKTRWELPELDLTPQQWADHRADLEARRPFRDLVIRRLDHAGRPVYARISGEPLLDASGAFRGYWGVGKLVTTEVEAQRALAASERRFRDLFLRSPTPFVIHRDGRIVLANEAAARLFGYESAAAMQGVALAVHDHPETRERAREQLAAAEALLIGESAPLTELRLRRCDGSELVVDAQVMRVDQADGPATLSIYFDLTERKRAQAQLARSEALLSRLFETSVDSILVADVPDGRIVLANQGFTEILGIPVAQARGRTTLEVGIWAEPQQRTQFIAALRAHGRVRDFAATMRRADGALRSLRLSSAVFQLGGADFSVTIARDVTQEQIDRLQYEAILDNASVGIAFTRNRRFELANARFEEMLGWPRGEIRGQPGEVVWPSAEDYAEIGRIAGPRLSRGEPVELERELRRCDGSRFWCHMRGQVVDARNPVDGGTIWIAEDITQRRAAEAALAAAKEAAEAASRAKSAFLANTSHEIRTPLNGVLGLARLALDPDVDPRRAREYLQRIHDSAQALSAIMSDILDLSKIEAGKLSLEQTAFDLRATLDVLFAGYRELALSKGLAFELAVGGNVPRHVSGDPMRVRQILANFVANAIKFTERGRVGIDVAALPDGRIRFCVSDTGIGIDASARPRLFTPFTQADVSTTRRFGGTGLGLSICRQLAELMGGRVDFESSPGAGSRFWADLPLPVAAAPLPAPSQRDTSSRNLAGLRVLLVEDNPVNMLIAETLLRNWQVEVAQAHDGAQAVAAVEAAGGAFDAVLMDVHMPVMSGHEATAALRRRYSKEDLPIVALTAAALASEQAQSLAVGMNEFITKPFDATRLCEVLLQVTAHRRQPAGAQ
jgi:PAS domain S-box-containing protein